MLQEAVRSLKEKIRGIRFKGDSRRHLQGEFWTEEEEEAYNDRKSNVRITKRYYYPYFGHYSPEKYREQMKKYKQGLRKSRPNGRIWHQVPKHIISNNHDYWMVACGKFRRPRS